MEIDIEDIIMKQLATEKLSEEEKICFEEWYKEPSNQSFYQDLWRIRSGIIASSAGKHVDREKAWKKVRPPRKISPVRVLVKYAAIIVLPLCVGWFLFLGEREKEETLPMATTVVKPGEKLAVLTLSTGKQVDLSGAASKMNERGAEISNSENNELIYKPVEGTPGVEEAYNRLTIPRGGEYKLVLSDGTIVWLNSDSYLRFPVTFSGDKRQVELRGEAYFEVAQHAEKPFIVKMNEYDIRVTGTQFNVRNYPDENLVTTLVEGNVQLERDHQVEKLIPGQQALFIDGHWVVKEVDVADFIAWREGTFNFREVRLENLMNELARWYDFQIYYRNPEVKDYHFTAWFRRNASIEEVIEVLEKTKKIKMKLDGKTLIVQVNSI